MLVKTPYYNISSIKAFALEGWTLGKTHGLPHWQRVERNGILLSLKEYNGSLYLRKDINLKVIRLFAYLHDKCRLGNHNDWKHGERAADMLYTIRNTLLKDLISEEFHLLEKACRFHTTMHKTGNPTIDICFDADRLDLGRVVLNLIPQKWQQKEVNIMLHFLMNLKGWHIHLNVAEIFKVSATFCLITLVIF